MDDLWVCEYSTRQNTFHIDQLSKILVINRGAILSGKNPGYIPLYVARSIEDAHRFAERWGLEHGETALE